MSWRAALLVSLVCLLATSPGCVRNGFEAGRRDIGGDRAVDTVAVDRGLADGARDAAVERLQGDTSPDFGAPPSISCDPPQPLSSFAGRKTRDVAVSPDGLRIIAEEIVDPRVLLTATRSSLTAAFGPVSIFDNLPPGSQDLIYWPFPGDPKVVVALSVGANNPRRLFRCPLPAPSVVNCTELELWRRPGEPVKSDADGVSILVTPQGPAMALNIAPGADLGDIYFAEPLDSTLLRWQVRYAEGFNSPGKEDDPVFHPDGRVLIFSIDGKFHYAARAASSLPFGAPQVLGVVGSSGAWDAGPQIFVLPDGRFELYFNSTRIADEMRLFRAICRYQ